jgi:hypothetical protein
MTGGVLHASGGAERNDQQFTPEQIGNRTWRIRVANVSVGEFGFLPPGVSSQSIASNGKMYTFGITEGGHPETPPATNEGQALVSVKQEDPPTKSQIVPDSQVMPDGTIGAFSDQAARADGVLLSRVTANGPADRAGLKAGDTILAVENHYLFTTQELADEIRRYRPGTKIAIRYRRYSTINETVVLLGAQ